ncbi:hypothetical protein CDAR_581 [Caerostris darwini]|uniref:Uncharacterized protein n=1 Tax=Caerostris darwini TaxID=1538125 RepID=A0AAV4UCE7_9ARAC|nr:hypothetical protein CDAR_581 [Caerostris darwini]
MGESDEILIDAEMPIISSNNRKRVHVMISSSDEDEFPQQIQICRKKAKLNNDMGFNEQLEPLSLSSTDLSHNPNKIIVEILDEKVKEIRPIR